MFSGSIVALITPLTPDDKVDYESLESLIEYHITAKTKGIVSVGTTGESATLDINEHIHVIKRSLEFAKGRIPIIAGTGANATHEVIAMNRLLDDSGIAGCLSVTPYYNKPPQEGLYQHFKLIAQNTDIPQILYNVPGRTGVDLLPETVGRLSEIKNIVGIKDATGDLSRVQRTVALCGKDFLQLSGDDFTSLEFVKLGGHGTISVTANVAATQMAKLFDYALQGKFEEAEMINEQLNPLHQSLFVEANPIPVKWLAHQLDLIRYSAIRLPLVELDARFHDQLLDAASHINNIQ